MSKHYTNASLMTISYLYSKGGQRYTWPHIVKCPLQPSYNNFFLLVEYYGIT